MKINSTNIQGFTDVQRQFEHLKFELEKYNKTNSEEKYIEQKNGLISGLSNNVFTEIPEMTVTIPKTARYKITLNAIGSITHSSEPTSAGMNFNIYRKDVIIFDKYTWNISLAGITSTLWRGEYSKFGVVSLNKKDVIVFKALVTATSGTITNREIKIATMLIEEI